MLMRNAALASLSTHFDAKTRVLTVDARMARARAAISTRPRAGLRSKPSLRHFWARRFAVP